MYTIIALSIFVASLVAIGLIARRHFSQVAAIDVHRLPKEIHLERKKDIIQERLERKAQRLAGRVQPIWRVIRRGFHAAYGKAREWEDQYRRRVREQDPTTTQMSHELLQEATELHEDEDFRQAEKKYVELISLNPQNLDAYRGLAELYFQQKDYVQSVEAYGYCAAVGEKTLVGGQGNVNQLASDYADLGIAQRGAGQNDQAVESFERATQLEANNPRYLDLLLQTSILMEDKVRGWAAYDKLRAANRENRKLAQYKEQLEELDAKTRVIIDRPSVPPSSV